MQSTTSPDRNALREAILLNQKPLMVTKAEAAVLCGMSAATYDKYARQKLLPAPNATGRISVAALEQAVWKLDGLELKRSEEDPDAVLDEWINEYGRH